MISLEERKDDIFTAVSNMIDDYKQQIAQLKKKIELQDDTLSDLINEKEDREKNHV